MWYYKAFYMVSVWKERVLVSDLLYRMQWECSPPHKKSLSGWWVWKQRARATFERWWCLHSTMLFCYDVAGQECWKRILKLLKGGRMKKNYLSLSTLTCLTSHWNCVLTNILKNFSKVCVLDLNFISVSKCSVRNYL